MSSPTALAAQYDTDANLRIRIETHQRYTVGPSLEPEVDRLLQLQPHESLLDLGTGPGDFLLRLFWGGHIGRLVGIDTSPGMIAKASRAASSVEFLQADAQAIPFADGLFDVVTARHMLYHVPNIPLALREIRRVLKPAGRFLAVTNASDYMADFWDVVGQVAGDDPAMRPLMKMRGSTVFNEHTGPQFIQAAFGQVKTHFVDAALSFTDAEPALRYFDSCRTFCSATDEHWMATRSRLAREIEKKLAPGSWRISKRAVILTSTRP